MKRTPPSRSFHVALALVAGLGLLTPPAGAVRNPIPGTTIRIDAAGGLASLDPVQATTPAERLIVANLFDRLVRRGADGSWRPSAAASWHVSADSLEWTFVLRPGMTFTDGRPVTAKAILQSWNRSAGSASGTTRLAGVTMRAGEGVVVLRGSRQMPENLLEQLADPGFGITATVDGPNGGSLVGSGPFRLGPSPRPGEFVLVPRMDHRLGRAMPAGIVVTSRPGQPDPFEGLTRVRGVIADPASGTLDLTMAFADSAPAPVPPRGTTRP